MQYVVFGCTLWGWLILYLRTLVWFWHGWAWGAISLRVYSHNMPICIPLFDGSSIYISVESNQHTIKLLNALQQSSQGLSSGGSTPSNEKPAMNTTWKQYACSITVITWVMHEYWKKWSSEYSVNKRYTCCLISHIERGCIYTIQKVVSVNMHVYHSSMLLHHVLFVIANKGKCWWYIIITVI